MEKRVLSASRNKKMSKKNSDWPDLHSNLYIIGTGHYDRPGMGHMGPFQSQVPHGVGRVLSIKKGEGTHCNKV